MPKNELDFFLHPDEASELVTKWLAESGVSALLWVPTEGDRYHEVQAVDPAVLQLAPGKEVHPKIFFRNDAVSKEYIYRTTANGTKRIDFVASGLVEFEPCMMVGNNVLLMGRLAILRPIYYKESKFARVKQLQKWFRKIGKDIEALRTTDVVVGVNEATGGKAEYRDIVISPGARELEDSGVTLRQLPDAPVRFYSAEEAAKGMDIQG